MRHCTIIALLAMALAGCPRIESPPIVAVGDDWAVAKQSFTDRGHSFGDNRHLQVMGAKPEFYKGFNVELPGDCLLVVSPDAKLERVASLTLTEEHSRGKAAWKLHFLSQINLDSLQYHER